MNEAIIEKIRKIQALAENAGTEAEAALAAERVAELCRKHNLEIGVAQLTREEMEASEARHSHDTGRYQAHWSYLSKACEEMFGVGVYRNTARKTTMQGGRVVGVERNIEMVFYGLKASVQAAEITYNYLFGSVEAMLAGWIRTGSTRGGLSERRSFRIGCSKRVYEMAKALHGQRQMLNTGESNALVRLENQLIKAHATKMRLRAGSRMAGYGSTDAYSAGYAAGGRVNIHGANGRMLN